MDVQMSEPENLPVIIFTAKEAKNSMPQYQPVDRKLYRKVINYSLEVIKQRSSVGFSYVNLSLTKMPELENRRIKLLKRLGYEVRELDFGLEVSWNQE